MDKFNFLVVVSFEFVDAKIDYFFLSAHGNFSECIQS
jgi:hypothetical protein